MGGVDQRRPKRKLPSIRLVFLKLSDMLIQIIIRRRRRRHHGGDYHLCIYRMIESTDLSRVVALLEEKKRKKSNSIYFRRHTSELPE
jgi:hypothetical protein